MSVAGEDTPLFGDEDRKRGVCRSCLNGWTHEDNHPTEKGLAQIAEAKKPTDCLTAGNMNMIEIIEGHPSHCTLCLKRHWLDAKVRHKSGAWECGCDDIDGTCTKVDTRGDVGEPEDGHMAFVGTSCGWSWIPIKDLVRVVDETNASPIRG